MRHCLLAACSSQRFLAAPPRSTAARCAHQRMGLGGSAAAAAGQSASGSGSDQTTAAPPSPPATAAAAGQQPQFRVLSEEVLHKRYLTLYNQTVQFPPTDGQTEGPVLDFDVVGHPQCDFHFSVVFPYHSADGGSVTLIREYAQGLNQLAYCLPTGGFDPRRHASYEACGRAELSEEARLAGGTWVPLTPPDHPGIAEVKWCRNRFHAFLVVDPQPDTAPGKRDKEELTIEVLQVSVAELRRLMSSGDMLLPSVATCFWALERIAEMQHQEAQQTQQQQQQQQQEGAPQQ